jgi:hypothetical protein
MSKQSYTPEFIARVKAAYPDYSDLHRLLDSGGVMVGRYLCDSVPDRPTFEEIIDAFMSEDLMVFSKFLASARNGLEKQNLWRDWQQTEIAKANGYGTK